VISNAIGRPATTQTARGFPASSLQVFWLNDTPSTPMSDNNYYLKNPPPQLKGVHGQSATRRADRQVRRSRFGTDCWAWPRTGDMMPIAGPELARLAPIGSESPSGPPRRLIAAHEASCYQRPASVLSSTVLPESAPPAAPQPRQVCLSRYLTRHLCHRGKDLLIRRSWVRFPAHSLNLNSHRV